MTNEEAIKRFEFLAEKKKEEVNLILEKHPEWDELLTNDAETFEMAIVALRAQQEPVKLDRSRWEGCNFCNYELENYPSINACNGDWGDYSVSTYKPSYCPICGCPLTEEAWAELEKRIGGCR